MTRTQAIAKSQRFFDTGGFQEVLARRECGHDDELRHHVGQHLGEQDTQSPSAGGARRRHVVQGAHLLRGAAHDHRVAVPFQQAQHGDDRWLGGDAAGCGC